MKLLIWVLGQITLHLWAIRFLYRGNDKALAARLEHRRKYWLHIRTRIRDKYNKTIFPEWFGI